MDSTDSYATAKANLRDTVKWVATTIAALGALVLAGAPFSGFGSLVPGSPRFLIATGGLGLAGVLLLRVWWVLIFLLRSDAVYESQLGEDFVRPSDPVEASEIITLRDHLKARRSDLIPKPLKDFDELRQYVKDLWKRASETRDKADTDRYEDYRRNLDQYLYYAAFERLHQRVTRALGPIVAMSGIAMVCLLAFAWASSKAKSDEGEHVTVVQPFAVPAGFEAPSLKSVIFATDQAVVDDEGIAAVGQVRDLLRAHPEAAVLLLTHTDTVGSTPHNVDLAARRGAAVRALLAGTGGIAASRVFTSDLPKASLPDVTRDQTERAGNRTVEFVIVTLPKRS
jgi:outer membrane protein OmpA-like peptidoglycan-associated protein